MIKPRIKINIEQRIIEIADGYPKEHRNLLILCAINLINSVLSTVILDSIDFLKVLWFVLGLATIIIFIVLFLYRSKASVLFLDDIVSLKKEWGFNKDIMRIKLKNGKTRPVQRLATETEDEKNAWEILTQLLESNQISAKTSVPRPF